MLRITHTYCFLSCTTILAHSAWTLKISSLSPAMAAATRTFQPRQSGAWEMTYMTTVGCKYTRMELQVTKNHINKSPKDLC